MSRNNSVQELTLTYTYLIKNCEPKTVTAARVVGLLDRARDYLAEVEDGAGEAEVVKARVYFRNAANTLLKRADWIGDDARRSLLDFISEQPEYLSEGDYKFTYDYFSDNIGRWRIDLARFAGRPGLSFLEVGSFEGKSTCWLLQNILTHETSRMTCIDVFYEEKSQGSYDTTGLDSYAMSLEDRFEHNVRQTGARDRVKKVVGLSGAMLRTLEPSSYDFIYIDGSHIAADVLEDAVLAWQLLKPGGVMTFDDYLWQEHQDPLLCPQLAIDAFLKVFEGRYRLLHQAYQVTLEKLP
jgi:hypothetical protein